MAFLRQDTINTYPSAWCAVECALLDLLSKQSNQSVESYLGLNTSIDEFNYSAVIGSEGIDVFYKTIRRYEKLNFSHYKLKISGNLDLDKQKVDYIKGLNPKSIRLDGNNIWRDPHHAVDYIKNLDYHFSGIEEPVSAGDFTSMHAISKALNTKIILDESFLNDNDFRKLTNNHFIINIRVSKMGGILRSLDIANRAKEQGIKIIIGAQVGETSILTRAALVVAGQNSANLMAQEGAFGNYLLRRDITEDPLVFGVGGVLNLCPNHRFGFGVDYNVDAIREYLITV